MKQRKNNQTILVTGGAGFIGSHVAKRLMDLGNRVIIADNFNAYYDPRLKEARISEFLKEYDPVLYRVDIADMQKLGKIFKKEKIDIVCHLAAQAGVRYSLKNPSLYASTNIQGTLNLLEQAKEFPVKGFIYVSSASVYGGNKPPFHEDMNVNTPRSLYAATKIGAEALVHNYHAIYGFPCTILRYFSVYGPWGRPDVFLFKFAKAIERGKPIDVYNRGRMKRSWTYVDDIVQGTVLAMEKNYAHEIFNLANPKPELLSRFIELLEASMGKEAKKGYLPMQEGDIKESFASIEKAKRMLKWSPHVGIREGIERFAEWYKKDGRRFKEFVL